MKFVSHYSTSLQIIEPFTAHYVFALGVARFLGCAHWIIQVSIRLSCPSYHLTSIKRPWSMPSPILNKNTSTAKVYIFVFFLEKEVNKKKKRKRLNSILVWFSFPKSWTKIIYKNNQFGFLVFGRAYCELMAV